MSSRFARLVAIAAMVIAGHAKAAVTDTLDTPCEVETLRQERLHNYPTLLLTSIARAESGLVIASRRLAWPWTINVEGVPFYFRQKEDAVRAVRSLLANGYSSIDVGCMQINLKHHPAAFSSLEEAFDPAANVAYAARFILQLAQQQPTWRDVVGHYHSADPARQQQYLEGVVRNWRAIVRAQSTGR